MPCLMQCLTESVCCSGTCKMYVAGGQLGGAYLIAEQVQSNKQLQG